MLEYQRIMIERNIAHEEDFDKSGFLKSRITFKALIVPWESSRRVRIYTSDEGQELEKEYWLLKDKFGASFSTRERELVEAFDAYQARGELIVLSGKVRIVRGSTYLNAESLERFDINEYEDISDQDHTEVEER